METIHHAPVKLPTVTVGTEVYPAPPFITAKTSVFVVGVAKKSLKSTSTVGASTCILAPVTLPPVITVLIFGVYGLHVQLFGTFTVTVGAVEYPDP